MYRQIFHIAFALLLFWPVSVQAQEISMAEVYQAISRERTPYDAAQSKAPAEEVRYLDHLFYVTDMATRARVLMMQKLTHDRGGMSLEDYNAEIANILASFALIAAPNHYLRKVETLVIRVIEKQQLFFNQWAALKGSREYNQLKLYYYNHRHVQDSHLALQEAAVILTKLYVIDTDHNQQAIKHHLDALDFIAEQP